MDQRSVVEADRLLVLLAAVPMALSRRHRDHDATCICLPLTRDCSTAASLHHRAFDLRNPAPPPFSLFEPPKTLPKLAS